MSETSPQADEIVPCRSTEWVSLTVRLTELSDAAAIARIHSQGIEERVATFETEPRSAADIEARPAGPHPAVVVERHERVVAWAGASEYRSRACYAGISQFSVYTDRSARGVGAAKPALAELMRVCEQRG